jgi:hypothetical protein
VNDVKALLPVVQQLQAVSQQLSPDLGALASFEAETPKIAPGDYLQVNVIANVLLPSGPYEPSPVDAPSSAETQNPSNGSPAVSDLLESGLL